MSVPLVTPEKEKRNVDERQEIGLYVSVWLVNEC